MDKDYVSIRRLGRYHTQLEGLFVQKVSGKGLSTEDYTTEEKTKLAGIASGAEVNVIEGVQVNGTDLTPDANRKVNVVVPENVVHKVSGATSGNFAALNAQGDLTDSGKDASDFGSAADVAAINEKIPTQASAQNKLADKAFVNSSVQTATANFRGNYLGWGAIPTTSQSYPPDYAGGRTPTTNDYMVVANTKEDFETPVAKWEQGGNYVEGQFVVCDDDPYGMFRAKHHITDSQIFPLDDQENWEELPYEWYDAWYAGGTWRFKYTGNWDNNGISGWSPEYQVNEEPLTAAQIAALNSNITEALTNKLVALPSKPVNTASQTLTEAEKAQARTNIGATAPEVFWATYGTTTAAEIDAAVSAGKVVLCKDSGLIYILVSDLPGATFKYFYAAAAQVTKRLSVKNEDSSWEKATINLQEANLVTSWQATPDNTHYPSEKLVYDSLNEHIFWATYGTTTAAEVAAAATAGKSVRCIYNNSTFFLKGYSPSATHLYFVCSTIDGVSFLRLQVSNDSWLASIKYFQEALKVTSWQATPDNTHYPSEKLVKDSLDGKQPLIDSSHKLDYSLLDNTPSIPSAPVNMTGATASTAGSAGYAPAPAEGDNEKFLRGDGTWQEAGGDNEAVEVAAAALCDLDERKFDKDKLVDTYNSYVANAHEKAASAYALYNFYRTITSDLLVDEEILATALNNLNALGILASAIAPLYKAGTRTFTVDDCCIYESQFYRCTTPVTSPEPFDPTKWERTNLFTEMVRRFNAL